MSRVSGKRKKSDNMLRQDRNATVVAGVLFGVIAAGAVGIAGTGAVLLTSDTETITVTVAETGGETQIVSQEEAQKQNLETQQAVGYKFENGEVWTANPKTFGGATLAIGAVLAAISAGATGEVVQWVKETNKELKKRSPKTTLKTPASGSLQTGRAF